MLTCIRGPPHLPWCAAHPPIISLDQSPAWPGRFRPGIVLALNAHRKERIFP
jgi:hypothetical protein